MAENGETPKGDSDSSQQVTVCNKKGEIVASLYIDEEGNLHEDTWLCPNGFPIECVGCGGETDRDEGYPVCRKCGWSAIERKVIEA